MVPRFMIHNIGVVEYIADEIAVMQRGRIEEAGHAKAVLERPQSAYTRKLLSAVPRIAAIASGCRPAPRSGLK